MNPTNEQELRDWLHQMHVRIMGDYDGDPWAEHPYQDESNSYFWEDEAKNLEALITAHTNAEITKTLDRLESTAVYAEYDKAEDDVICGDVVPLDAIQAERNKLKEVK